ncbi:hypothetical protein PCASD_03758 [Puccinia coronata f. sp. avenae]|uniref:Uncharacterized protein n=1 Tax=Puccinia coronata f. sp. avenae TaxID=200324 RepID=A0A2N5V8G1_9BASI|nr:hypothetical protein PCASD_03758 [Puccinia coronata f. sp. avenae]
MDWNRFSAGLWLLIFVGYLRAFTTFGRLTPNGSPERFYFPLVGGDLTEESSAVRKEIGSSSTGFFSKLLPKLKGKWLMGSDEQDLAISGKQEEKLKTWIKMIYQPIPKGVTSVAQLFLEDVELDYMRPPEVFDSLCNKLKAARKLSEQFLKEAKGEPNPQLSEEMMKRIEKVMQQLSKLPDQGSIQDEVKILIFCKALAQITAVNQPSAHLITTLENTCKEYIKTRLDAYITFSPNQNIRLLFSILQKLWASKV